MWIDIERVSGTFFSRCTGVPACFCLIYHIYYFVSYDSTLLETLSRSTFRLSRSVRKPYSWFWPWRSVLFMLALFVLINLHYYYIVTRYILYLRGFFFGLKVCVSASDRSWILTMSAKQRLAVCRGSSWPYVKLLKIYLCINEHNTHCVVDYIVFYSYI